MAILTGNAILIQNFTADNAFLIVNGFSAFLGEFNRTSGHRSRSRNEGANKVLLVRQHMPFVTRLVRWVRHWNRQFSDGFAYFLNRPPQSGQFGGSSSVVNGVYRKNSDSVLCAVHLLIYNKVQPRAFGINHSLSIQQRSFRRLFCSIGSPASLNSLPNNRSESKNYRQCGDAFRPSYEFIEPVHFLAAFGSLLFGLGLIGGKIWGNSRPGRWFGWAFLIMAWILLMSGRQHGQTNQQRYHSQGFVHEKNVSQKHLTYT